MRAAQDLVPRAATAADPTVRRFVAVYEAAVAAGVARRAHLAAGAPR